MACGGRQKNKPSPPPAPVMVLGEKGLTEMKYTGLLENDYYVGEETKHTYTFGLLRSHGYIDSRDVTNLLTVIEDEQKVFEVA